MTGAAVNTEKLDAHLLEIVQALQGAVKRGIPNVNDPKVSDQAIRDCKEILDEVMAGNVSEWIKN